MRFLVLVFFGLVAATAALPIANEAVAQSAEDEAYIIKKIIDVEQVKQILKDLLEHGKSISKATLEQMIKIARGAAKQMLQKILEHINKIQGAQDEAYIIDKIVDVDRLKKILADLLEHGKSISRSTVEQLLKIAKGAARDMLLKILEHMNQNKSEDAYILNKIGVDMEKIRNIINELRTNGKDAAIKKIKELLENAKGALKRALEALLKRINGAEDEAYVLEQIKINREKIREILEELKTHGKAAAIEMIKKVLESAKGSLKLALEALLKRLNGSEDAYILDKIRVDMEKIKNIINELRTNGKDAAIKKIKELLENAKGALKRALEALLKRINGAEDEAYFISSIDRQKILDVLNTIKEHGKAEGIKLIKNLLQTAHGLLRELLKNILGRLEE